MRVVIPEFAVVDPKQPEEAQLVRRVLGFLSSIGPSGVTRTHLIQRYRLTAERLDSLLGFLRQREGFEEWTASSGGRPSQRFRYTPSFSVRDQDGGQRCIWCHGSIPVGSSSGFCSDTCKKLGAEQPVKIKELFERPAVKNDVRTLMLMGAALVEADLISRGYDVARSTQGVNARLLAATPQGLPFSLELLMAPAHGEVDSTFFDGLKVETVAVVFASGRIIYYGLPADVEDSTDKEKPGPR